MERCQYGWVEICHLSEPTSDCDVFYLLIPKFWTGTLGMKRSTYRTTCPVTTLSKTANAKDFDAVSDLLTSISSSSRIRI